MLSPQTQQQAPCGFDALPDHILCLIAQHLAGGSLENFRQTCKHFRQAANQRTKVLDFHEVCGWGDNTAQLPDCAKSALNEHPNAIKLVIPSSWRLPRITEALQRIRQCRSAGVFCSHAIGAFEDSSSSSSTNCFNGSRGRGVQLNVLELHFQAISPTLCEALAALAPGLTRLELSLDLAFELTTKQVGPSKLCLTTAGVTRLTGSYAAAKPTANTLGHLPPCIATVSTVAYHITATTLQQLAG